MQRFAAVWHASPQKMVGILFALLLAAMMAVGSGANFNSTSANPGNVVTAGTLSHSNSKNNAILMTVSKIKPGESKTGTVQLTNTGDIDGVFSVARTMVRDSTGDITPTNPTSNPFAAHLNLKIEDNVTGTVYYDDLLSAMTGTVSAGTITPGNSRTYKFTIKFNDANVLNPALPNGADNAFKGASVEADFNWEAVNN
jgi:hypothetical protein